ncbi:MAG TPA: DUF2064 domain-containing protein [Thermoanaerobaculia bacterium]|nr:DUF2064 domain-containing protein [Thermoanaerobaculia bacterium]
MSRRRALVVFTRSPEAEARAKGFSSASAAPLFRALLDSWVRLARETGTDLVLASPAACRRRLEGSGIAPEARFLTQRRAAFGERVAAIFRETFALGFESVVLVGADGPAIEPRDLRRAFAAAEAGEVALGPANDGGVYLIGMDGRDADLARCLRLRDPRALVSLLSAAADRRRGVVLFAPRREIDSTLDAVRVRGLAGVDPDWSDYRLLLELALRPACPARRLHRPAAPAPFSLGRAPRGPPAA